MLKRLTYISHFAEQLSAEAIHQIGRISRRNNRALDVTGVLICSGGFFFQILEGEADAVDALYVKILADKRHTDILCLKTENDISERLFPDWSMEVFNLDTDTAGISFPLRAVLRNLSEAQEIIGKYTQPAVLKYLQQGGNPLLIRPHKRERIILFGDIVGFSTLSERLPVEELGALINAYLELVSHIIDAHGGEVSKYIGDCVMAYFSVEHTDAALQTALLIQQELAALRAVMSPEHPYQLLYCGIGLARGEVMEGNFGSSVKMDHTVIGDAVNTAARLEALTRELDHSVLVSAAVKRGAQQPWPWLSLGEQDLKGKNGLVEVFTLDGALGLDKAAIQRRIAAAKTA